MRDSTVLRRLRLPVLAASAMALVVAGLAASSGTAAATTGGNCTEYSVPVALTENGPEDYTIVGDLCLPEGETTTIQLLVHGATYNRSYWDFPHQPQLYSYVRMANQMGYATFAVDSLGAGESSRPHSSLVDLNTTATALHDVITKLRAGTVNSVAYDKVIYVGHSFGTIVGWGLTAAYGGVDAFIATGAPHAISATNVGAATAYQFPASQDPKFAPLNLDNGYSSFTEQGRADFFYYAPTSSQQVIDVDYDNRDVVTAGLQAQGIPLFFAPATAITVPVLSILGDKDMLFCAADALDCDDVPAVTQHESGFYPNASSFDLVITPQTGHDLNTHFTAPFSFITMLNWAQNHVAP